MCTSGLLLLLLLPAVSPVQPSALPQPDPPEFKLTFSKKLLSVTETVIQYLDSNAKDINTTDIIMCLQIVKVELKGAEEAMATDPVLQPLSQQTRNLSKTLEVLINKSIHQLSERDPVSLQEYLPITQSEFWKLPDVWTPINASLIYCSYKDSKSLLEDNSNLCVRDMLGTAMTSSQPCDYSAFCKKLITTTGATGIYVTSQMLYFLTSRMVGCTKGMFQKTQYYLNLFCANMMKENQDIKEQKFSNYNQEIFLRNIMFCGFAGYTNFFNVQWMKHIIRWPDRDTGCFRIIWKKSRHNACETT